MSSLEENDRERQREKSKGRVDWAKSLKKPRTLKLLMKIGPVIAQVVYWTYRLVEVFRS